MSAPDREEIRQKALAVLERVAQLRAAGGGSLPVAELLGVVGIAPEGALRTELERRGDLQLEFTADGGGTFRNAGPAFITPLGPAKLNVPPEIGGSLVWREDSLALEFDPARTMFAKALFLELRVQRLEISEHHVAVRFPGGTFDQEYLF